MVSTAIHEFFGVAIVEAIYAGCFPILPNRLSYTKRVPKLYHDVCLYQDFEGLVSRLRWALDDGQETRTIAGQLRARASQFDWSEVASSYDRELEGLVGRVR